jgi:16S rRNA (guanine966-N2)-methyltransferase
VRITGGRYRGRTILCPPGEIRPSMDRMRQSLFSILGDLEGASFLDLFSGSGILGVEAASRGAAPVLLVEKDPRKRTAILRNISFVETAIDLVTAPVERFLRTNQRSWDIVFLDPPFAREGKETILDAAGGPPHLAPGGLVIIHRHSAEKLSAEDRPGLELADRRAYGQSLLLFFRRRADAVEPAAPEPPAGSP